MAVLCLIQFADPPVGLDVCSGRGSRVGLGGDGDCIRGGGVRLCNWYGEWYIYIAINSIGIMNYRIMNRIIRISKRKKKIVSDFAPF